MIFPKRSLIHSFKDHLKTIRAVYWEAFCLLLLLFRTTGVKRTEKRATKKVKLVLQHCCKTSWIAMLRVLPPTFNTVNKNLICCKTCLMWVENAQHRCSTSFAAMLQNKLHVFCCPFFRTFRNTSRLTISSRLNWPTMSITRVLYSQLTWYNSIWLWGWLPCRWSRQSLSVYCQQQS